MSVDPFALSRMLNMRLDHLSYAAGPDGLGIALKVEDGSMRAMRLSCQILAKTSPSIHSNSLI